MSGKLTLWLRERAQAGADRRDNGAVAGIPGGPSFAYVFGWVLVMMLGVQAITGAALAMFYASSTASAWASVAYVQDRMPLGWLVRGLHFHGGSALVIVAGVHLVQTAVWGAYKKPRELTWWLGIVLLLLILGFAVTGYVLRWDQAGYWANHVEVNIAASAPGGSIIRALALGGNDYGNLTLTRFYALHVVILPGIVTLMAVGHVWLARRHGTTPRWGHDGLGSVARWPQQAIRNAIAMAAIFAVLLGYVISVHGADLAAPADPAASYDAQPLWYFRWLFELRQLAGSGERIAALTAPVIVGGFLVGLPLVDRGADRSPRVRKKFVAAVLALFAIIGALTFASFYAVGHDQALADREAAADKLASRARQLALDNGVPVTGALDVFGTPPMHRARALFAQYCASCHDAQSKDRKGPIIGPGHGGRAWLAGFLKAPGGDAYWGHTKLAATDDAMKPVELPATDVEDLVELLWAQTGASDLNPDAAARGRDTFKKASCDDCHSIEEGVAGQDAPDLAGLGTRDWYTGYIGNPHAKTNMSAHAEMPRFAKDLSIVDRDALAAYLVWLQSATPADVAQLGPL